MSLKNIILSRIKPNKNQKWVEDRRTICLSCPHNTLNSQNRSFNLKVIKALSNLLSWLMRAENEDLGECDVCFCPIYQKTLMEDETCSLDFIGETPKWKSIVKTKHNQKHGFNK